MKIRALVVEEKDAPFVRAGARARGAGARRGAGAHRRRRCLPHRRDHPRRRHADAVPGRARSRGRRHRGAGRRGRHAGRAGRQGDHRLAVVRGVPQLPRRAAALLPAHRRGARLGAPVQGRAGGHDRVLAERPADQRPLLRPVVLRHALASRSADALVKVPGDAPLELLGPLACGLATGAGAVLNEARPRLGDSVLDRRRRRRRPRRDHGGPQLGRHEDHRRRRPRQPPCSWPRSSARRTRSTRARRTSSRRSRGSPARPSTSRSTAPA